MVGRLGALDRRDVSGLLDDVRTGAAAVARDAGSVRIDDDALRHLADTWDPTPLATLPEEHWSGAAAEVAMGVVAWNAVNFGSGWFPLLDKDPGLSGARTLATRWRRFYAERRPDAGWLVDVDRPTVARVFGQGTSTAVVELLDHFVDAWRELGEFLLEGYDGSAINLVEDADRCGATLAGTLGELGCWRDRHRHGSLDVPLFKRAQITVSHLHGALDPSVTDLGRFTDVAELTCFADNLVPHVLRHHRVLRIDDTLAERIEEGDLLVSGEPAEVELRAVAVHAVEQLVALVAARTDGRTVTAASIDHGLWRAGQDPAIKARPRHRCRCTFY